MTAEEALRAICVAVEAGDYAAAAEHFASDGIVLGTVGGIDETTLIHGRAAFARYYQDVAATWDEWQVRTDEVRGGGETFVVFWRETTRTRGIEMQNETATVFKFRDGEVVEARGYLDRAAALEAAGLPM
jgi:ketosteroid isomerase-like protein